MPTEIILLVLVIGVVLLIMLFLVSASGTSSDGKKREAKDLKGSRSSAAALRAARRFAMLHKYEVIAPASFPAKEGRAEADIVIVGCFGVLCVKCLGMGGTVYGGADEPEWAQLRAGARTAFANPVRECGVLTRAVREALFAAKRKNVPVESVCVFTNPKAELAIPRGTGHLTLREFRALLGRDKYLYDKGVDEKAVAEILRAAAKA